VALALGLPGVAADPGKTGLTFLKLDQGARAAGMGGAFTSVANDASATYWNPAGCAGGEGGEVLLSQARWFQDISIENIAVVQSTPDQGFGLSFTALHTSEMELRDSDGAYLGHFRFFDFAVQGTYARRLTQRLTGGLSAKALYEKIDEETALGFAADLGVVFHPPVKGLRIGACVQHLGTEMKFIDESFDLPLTVRAGLAYRVHVPFVADDIIAAFDVQKPRSEDVKTHAGVELGVGGRLALRFGYRSGYDNQNVSVGVGLPVDRYRFDYAYVPFYSDLGDTHRISFGIRL